MNGLEADRRGLRHIFQRLCAAAVELLYPRGAWCPGCHGPIDVAEGWLCDVCQDKLDAALVIPPVCERCGRPLPREGAICAECLAWPEGLIEGTHAVFAYVQPLDNIVRALKYRGVHAMAPWLGGMMAHRLDDLLRPALTPRPNMLVPVPMYPGKQRKRGYNQAELLATEVGAHLGIPVVPAIARTRWTRAQAGLSGDERAHNLRGAFRPLTDLTGQHVLLVDDVLTTGSTALECAQALLNAGARTVTLAVLAATIPKEY